MKKKFAIHLQTLLPQVRKFDFQKPELLSSTSISRMVEIINFSMKKINKIIDDQEALHVEENEKNEPDMFLQIEIGSYLSLLRMQLGHQKTAISNLQSHWGFGSDEYHTYPLLPSLRDHKYLDTGEDVMVYVTKRDDKYKTVTPYSWVCAKVDNCGSEKVRLFTVNRIRESLDGDRTGLMHEVRTPSTRVFKRKEFFLIRKILQENTHLEFMEVFLHNFRDYIDSPHLKECEDIEAIKKIILDPSIEDISEVELAEKEKTLFSLIKKEYGQYGSIFLENVRRTRNE